jgi:large subunit ribosomal protein L29
MAEKIDPIRAMAKERLNEEEENTHKDLLNLRFRHATRQLVNVDELKQAKRRLARIKTIRRERELAGVQQ